MITREYFELAEFVENVFDLHTPAKLVVADVSEPSPGGHGTSTFDFDGPPGRDGVQVRFNVEGVQGEGREWEERWGEIRREFICVSFFLDK